ncbi:hypothetical protein bcere0024_027500 [Bacillus cereus Rock4-18]|nr:hypothetical protein bcere0024_027500 [Bacillus cereus Rock4-18]
MLAALLITHFCLNAHILLRIKKSSHIKGKVFFFIAPLPL